MTAPVTPNISERLELISRRFKTLSNVALDVEQYSLLPVRADRIQYTLREAQHQIMLAERIIRELDQLQNPQQEELKPCPENASTSKSPKDRGKDAAAESSGTPPPRETTLQMFKE